jgi:hypothetical protein
VDVAILDVYERSIEVQQPEVGGTTGHPSVGLHNGRPRTSGGGHS